MANKKLADLYGTSDKAKDFLKYINKLNYIKKAYYEDLAAKKRKVDKMNEYISKKDIIQQLCFTTGCAYDDVVIGTIMNFQAADVQPVNHGQWIGEYFDSDSDVWRAECSNCGGEIHSKFGRLSIIYKYCPNCGARMDGDTECQ